MNLKFNTDLAKGYKSNTQIVRKLSEDWVLNNLYCPSCGEMPLHEFENNRPVADYFCNRCKEEYELKSRKDKLSNSIPDGAYSTMIERIKSENNPNFFFLTYTNQWMVNNFLIVPKQFFTPEIIIKRNPLKETARRAGWVGCNINIAKIADYGKIFLIKNSKIINRQTVRKYFNRTMFLREQDVEAKGWVLDIMACIDQIKKNTFTLNEMYKFEETLRIKHPENNFIKDKIRQQLQVLRNKGIIEFLGRGNYKKL